MLQQTTLVLYKKVESSLLDNSWKWISDIFFVSVWVIMKGTYGYNLGINV
jgi:hypothetical protein